MLSTIFSPDGEMFEVAHNLARPLVISKGWTTKPPAEVTAVLGVDTQPGEVHADPSEQNYSHE